MLPSFVPKSDYSEGDVVIAISQSGETADTLAAIDLAKSKGAIIFGVCNVVGHPYRQPTQVPYTHAGPEIAWRAPRHLPPNSRTEYDCLIVAQKKGTITEQKFHEVLVEMENIPAKVEKALKLNAKIQVIADEFRNASNFIYLGRGYNFPVALEGALKLKEISYIHAEVIRRGDETWAIAQLIKRCGGIYSDERCFVRESVSISGK